jgi:hypothetical protein
LLFVLIVAIFSTSFNHARHYLLTSYEVEMYDIDLFEVPARVMMVNAYGVVG